MCGREEKGEEGERGGGGCERERERCVKEVKKGMIQYLSMNVYTPLVLHVPVVTRMLWEGGKGGRWGEKERGRGK